MNIRFIRLLASCALAAVVLIPGIATAASITKTLTIQVFDVCDDAGNNCASLGPVGDLYFSAEVNKIWAQAGISVGFNFVGNINSTLFSNIDDASGSNHKFSDLSAAYGTHGPSATTVDMFMAHTVAGAYGEGWLGWGGLVMGMDTVMAYNGGLGRIDTVAHELGHNFNLPHYDTNPSFLMASGGVRNVPTTIADIAPDGLGYDLLSSDQIAIALRSSLLHDVEVNPVPEPATCILFGAGLMGLAAIRRRNTCN